MKVVRTFALLDRTQIDDPGELPPFAAEVAEHINEALASFDLSLMVVSTQDDKSAVALFDRPRRHQQLEVFPANHAAIVTESEVVLRVFGGHYK